MDELLRGRAVPPAVVQQKLVATIVVEVPHARRRVLERRIRGDGDLAPRLAREHPLRGTAPNTQPAVRGLCDQVVQTIAVQVGVRLDDSPQAQIEAAPEPEKWMADPLRSRWLSDPLILDSAFQMAIIWCFENRGAVSLPAYSASYRQYRQYVEDTLYALVNRKSVQPFQLYESTSLYLL